MSTTVRFSYDQYQEMIRLGLFDPPEEHRVELIFGKIVPVYGKSPMSPINPPHDSTMDRLNEWSFEVLPRGRAWVRVQGSIGIEAFDSQPQPDLVWLARKDYSAKRPEPADVLLLIEVSDTTLKKDRASKARLYAEAGIQDYWIVNVKGRTIEVRRDPVGSKYQSVTIHKIGQAIHPLAFPDISLPVARLFVDGTEASR
jgi:Uma2 family endonuclease